MPVLCPECTDYYNQTRCIEDDGENYLVGVYVSCSSAGGCGEIATLAMAGFCDSDSPATHAVSSHPLTAEAPKVLLAVDVVYMNAFVRNCKGEFAATRIAVVTLRG